MAKKLCEICGASPATVPDRNRPGRLINRVCGRCYGLLLAGDMRELMRLRDVLKEAVQVCKDLDDEALAKENRLACGAECAAAIADLAARMNVHCEVNHE